MSGLSSRTADEKYINWLKGSLALNYFRAGLKGFVEDESKTFQRSINTSIFGNGTMPKSCDECSREDCSRGKREQKWKINTCRHNICDRFLAEIMQNYVQNKNIPKPVTDPKDWPIDYFSVIQLYFGPGGGNKKSLEDCDCPNFLNLFINCSWFSCCNTKSDLSLRSLNVLKHRNNLMHSTCMKLSTETMKDWLNDMIGLLESLKDFNNRPEAVRAVELIKETCDSSLQITLKDEMEIIEKHIMELRKKLEESDCVVKGLGEVCQDLSLDFQKIRTEDIQSLSSKIKDIADKYKSTCDDVRNVTNDMQNQSSEVEKCLQVKENLKNPTHIKFPVTLKKALIGTRDLLDQNPDLQTKMEARLNEVRRQYTVLATRLDEAESELARCTAMKNKLEHLERRICDTETSLVQLDEKMDETDFIVLEIEDTIGKIEPRLGETESAIAQIGAKMGETGSAVAKIGIKMGKTELAITQIGTNMGKTESAIVRIDTEIGETQSTVEQLGTRMVETENRLESTTADLDRRIATSETKFIKMDSRITGLEEKNTGDRSLSRNPKLERLKEDTRAFIKTRTTCGFIRTRQFLAAKTILEENGCVLISGKPGEGKTTSAVVMMTDLFPTDRCVILSKASDWECVDTSQVDIVFIDDIVGMYQLDSGKLREWLTIIDRVQACITEKIVKVVCCLRGNIMAECETQLKRFDMFTHMLKFSSVELSAEEKLQILNSKLTEVNKTMSEDDKSACVKGFTSPIGFPYCCHLFTTNLTLFQQKSQFFEKPYQFFVENIKTMDKTQMLAFLCIFYKGGKLNQSAFAVDESKGQLRKVVSEIADVIGDENEPKLGTIRNIIEHHCGVYIEDMEAVYVFAHNVMYETLGLIYGQRCPVDVIKYCTLDFLCECIDVDPERKSQGNLCVKPAQYEILAKRIIQEVMENGEIFKIAKHPAFLYHSFIDVLFKALDEASLTEKFLLRKDESDLSRLLDLNFYLLPEVLEQRSEKAVTFVERSFHVLNTCKHYSHLQVHECLKCKVRIKAFHASFLNRSVELPFSLIHNYDVQMSSQHLHRAVQVSRFDIASYLIKKLSSLKDQQASTQSSDLHIIKEDIQKTVSLCIETNNGPVLKTLLSSNLLSWQDKLLYAIKSGNDALVDIILNEYLYSGSADMADFNTNSFRAAIQTACELGKEKVIAALIGGNIEIPADCIAVAMRYGQVHLIRTVFAELKKCKPNIMDSEYSHGLLETFILNKEYGIIKIIVDEGVHPRPCCLNSAVMDISVLKLLLKAVTPAQPWCLKFAVRCGDYTISTKCVMEVKHSDQLDAGSTEVKEAVEWAHTFTDKTNLRLLVKNIFPYQPWCLRYAIECEDNGILSNTMTKLKESGQWEASVKDLREFSSFEADDVAVQNATERAFNSGYHSFVQLLISLISPPRTSYLKYTVVCEDNDVLCNFIGDLHNSGQFDIEDKYIRRVFLDYMNCHETHFLQRLINISVAISAVKPWCIKYASRCGGDVLCRVVKDLQDSGRFDSDSEEIRSAFRCLDRDDTTSMITLLNSISPVKPWCLKYAAYCGDDVLCRVVKDLQDSGQFDSDSEEIRYALDVCLDREDRTSMITLLNAISPVKPWCLEYAVRCGGDVLCRVVKDLQDSGQFDSDSEEIRYALDVCLDREDRTSMITLLNAISPVKPWCLEYAVRCGGDVLCRVVKDLQDSGQFDSDSEEIRSALDECFYQDDKTSMITLLNAISPVKPWCLKYAAYCGDDVLCRVVKDLQDSGQFDSHSEEIRYAFRCLDRDDTTSMITLLNAVSAVKPWCLKYAAYCGGDVLCRVVKDLQDSGQFDSDSEEIRYALDVCLDREDRTSMITLLNAISPVKPWCLEYAVRCGGDVLCRVVKDLQDSGQFDSDSEEIRSALDECFYQDDKTSMITLLNAISPVKPWCLKYAAYCGDDVLCRVVKDLQDSGQFDSHSEEIRYAFRCLDRDDTTSMITLLNAVSAVKPWCLKYAAYCGGDVLCRVVKDLQDSGQFDSHSEEIRSALDECLDRDDTTSMITLLNAISPVKPWCLKYAAYCGGDVLCRVVKDLQDSGQFDSHSEEIRSALDECLDRDDTTSMITLLNAISPVKPWCLKYAAYCGGDVLCRVVKDLQDSGQFDSHSEEIRSALDECLDRDDTTSMITLLNAISPVKPWCLKYAAYCGGDVLCRVVKDLQDSGQFDSDSEEIRSALDECFYQDDKTSMITLLNAISPVKPWCLKYAAYCGGDVLCRVVKDLQDSGQFDSHSEEIRYAFRCLDRDDTTSMITLLNAVSAVKPWCLKYAVRCGGDVLCRVVKDLQDSGQFDSDSEEIRSALDECFYQDDKTSMITLLNAISPVKPWCLKYAARCGGDVLCKVVKDLLDSGSEQIKYVLRECVYLDDRNDSMEALLMAIVDTLSENNYYFLHDTLHICLCKGHLHTVQMLLKKTEVLDLCCLPEAAVSANTSATESIVEELVRINKWDAHNQDVHKAIEISLEYGNIEATAIIRRAGGSLKPCCLRSACLSGNETTVQFAISDLKQNILKDKNCMTLKHKDIHRALRAASGKGNARAIELVLNANYPPKSCCLKHAINTNNRAFVLQFTRQLTSLGKNWCGKDLDVHHAVHESILKGYEVMAELLVANGASLGDCCLVYAVQSNKKDILEYVITGLLQVNGLDRNHEHMHEAVETSLKNKNPYLGEYILRALQHPRPCCVPLAVQAGSISLTEAILQRLKEIGTWDPANEHLHTALEMALDNNNDSVELIHFPQRDSNEKMSLSLMNFGVYLGPCCVKRAVCTNSVATVMSVTDKLKASGVWDVENKAIHDALHLCLCKGYSDLTNFFRKEGVCVNVCCLPDVVTFGKEDLVHKVIQKLHENKVNLKDQPVVHSALESSLEAGNVTVVEQLITAHVRPKTCCLQYVARSQNGELVVKVIKLLKEDDQWNTKHKEMHSVLKICGDTCQIKVLETFIKELVPPRICCLQYAIRTRNMLLINGMSEALIDSGQWQKSSMKVHEALEVSLNENNRDAAEYLLAQGARVGDCCLWHAVYSEDMTTVGFVIQKLKESEQWNIEHDCIHDALKLSVEDGHVPTTKCILEALSPTQPCCLQLTSQNRVLMVDMCPQQNVVLNV